MMTVLVRTPGYSTHGLKAFCFPEKVPFDLPNLFAHLIRKSRKPLSIYERLGYPF